MTKDEEDEVEEENNENKEDMGKDTEEDEKDVRKSSTLRDTCGFGPKRGATRVRGVRCWRDRKHQS